MKDVDDLTIMQLASKENPTDLEFCLWEFWATCPPHSKHEKMVEKAADELAQLQARIVELEKIAFAFYDVLDGNADAHEIVDSTGLPLARAKEIQDLYYTENETKREWRNS